MVMTKQKTTSVCGLGTFKRSRMSPTVTPLTRQVMAKSIHRAILEYQHTQNRCVSSPKSPLDLRVRAAISRGRGGGGGGTPVKCQMKTEHRLDKSLNIDGNSHSASVTTTTTITTTITNKQDSKAPNTLETVYEHEKNHIFDTLDNNEQNNVDTPMLLSRKKCIESANGSTSENDVWYTPKEYVQTNVIENVEVQKTEKNIYLMNDSMSCGF